MELFQPENIVGELLLRAEQFEGLPICCISMITYDGLVDVNECTIPGIVSVMKPQCIHYNGSKTTLSDIKKKEAPTEFPNSGLLPVYQDTNLMGFIGVTDRHLTKFSSNGELSFKDFFKARYLRYYLYHHSIRHHDFRTPVIILGEDPSLVQAVLNIGKYADSMLPVLLTGETGTGKELWARSLHLLSTRCQKPFLPINCSHLVDDQMAISTLFGHRRGSYTGAESTRNGFFEQANGGTLFLDEIECLHPRVQGMLLRTIETGEIQKLGADSPDVVDVKLVCASNSDLKKRTQSGQMRTDFLYRIHGHSIHLPPLRERIKNDINALADFYIEQLNIQLNQYKKLTSHTYQLLKNQPWYGNVRELKNTLISAYYNSENQTHINPEHFTPTINSIGANRRNDKYHLSESELFNSIVLEQESFWDVIYKPFMQRDLNRNQVSEVVQMGLQSVTNLKELTRSFNIPENQYRKFVDFLRNQRIMYS